MNLRTKETISRNTNLSTAIYAYLEQNITFRGISALFSELKAFLKSTEFVLKAMFSIRDQHCPSGCFVDSIHIGQKPRFVKSSLDKTGIN